MNNDWQNKLISFGASVDTEGNVSFADATDASGVRVAGQAIGDFPLLVDLSHLAVVDFTGADAKTFLYKQVCNDLASLTENNALLNGYCSPKGRLLAVFTVFEHEDGYRLLLPGDVAEAFTKRMRMFVLAAKVDITIRTDLICSGLVLGAAGGSGAGASETIQFPDNTPNLPATELQVSRNPQMQIMRWHDAPSDVSPDTANQSTQRFLCIAELDAMSALWETDSLRHTASSYWRWGDINAGIPNVYTSSSDQFIPQMMNMDLINGLSFSKRCYPGQEIVARLQYLGKLKKHMKHLRAPGATVSPVPGDLLTTDSNNSAGQVVDAVVDECGVNLLAVVNIDIDVNELKFGDIGLAIAPIPYSLVPDEAPSS